MSKKEIIAYAITHAPPGVKGGPYEASLGPAGTPTSSLRKAERWDPPEDREDAESSALFAAVIKTIPHARVIRIVRKGPRRLCDACGFLIEAESRRRAPSEASAVDVLRSFIAWVDCDDGEEETPLRPIEDAARAVLAASGPDPSEVVRAAMAEECARVRMTRAEHGIGDFAALETVWLRRVEATRVAVKKYRKAGGK